MTNDSAYNDIVTYQKLTLRTTFILLSLFLIAIFTVYFLGLTKIVGPLLGGMLGAVLSVGNLFSIGVTFYQIAIKKEKLWIIFLPLLAFLLMCISAFLIVTQANNLVFGFALGLTTPVLIGAVIVIAYKNPVDRG